MDGQRIIYSGGIVAAFERFPTVVPMLRHFQKSCAHVALIQFLCSYSLKISYQLLHDLDCLLPNNFELVSMDTLCALNFPLTSQPLTDSYLSILLLIVFTQTSFTYLLTDVRSQNSYFRKEVLKIKNLIQKKINILDSGSLMFSLVKPKN